MLDNRPWIRYNEGMAGETCHFINRYFTMKTIHLTVQLKISENADPYEVVENLGLWFTHEDILDTEIVNACDENNVDIF